VAFDRSGFLPIHVGCTSVCRAARWMAVAQLFCAACSGRSNAPA
jgi:hypothetical protein